MTFKLAKLTDILRAMSDNEQPKEQVPKQEDGSAPINIKVRAPFLLVSSTIRLVNANYFCLNLASFSLAVLDS